jgi:hypothetical protein
VAVVLALAAGACGTPVATTGGLQSTPAPIEAVSPGLPSPSSAPASPSPATGQTPALDTLPPATYPPSPGAGDVVLDASLLAILPTDLGGISVAEEGEAFADATEDPAFRRNVARAAFPIVASDEDLASGVVAQLISGRFTDQFFRDWRDSYDEGACAQSGGVAGNAETEIGGRTVYIGTCAGGLRTYHAWLEDRYVIVSLFSLGEGRFGEQLMAGLRP